MTIKSTRRRILAVSSGAAALSLLPRVPASARVPTLDFIIVGDWGRQGSWQQREVGAQMGRTAEAIASRFVISVGDNFYENGVTSLNDPQWQSSFEAIYPAAALQTPWHVILGNHDYRGNVAAEFAYATNSQRWNLPARYYQRTETLADGTPVDLFYIDRSPNRCDAEPPGSRHAIAAIALSRPALGCETAQSTRSGGEGFGYGR